MAGERVERRLAAVLAADVAGYSRLMGADEEGTLARSKPSGKRLVDPTIAAHRGRIVKTTGDGMLVEFASAVDALRCAVEVQRGMAEQNASMPLDEQIEFRIGIHVGDIIIDDNDIFGDGVNVAARLEGIAEPGGICISDDALSASPRQGRFRFEDMGPQSLKNIAEPMQAWRVRLGRSTLFGKSVRFDSWSKPRNRCRSRQAIHRRPAVPEHVGDPEQEYFADGMVEDIITALSRYKSLFVIARNSSFTYKGNAVDIRQVGPRAWRALCAGGQRAQGRQSTADHRPIDRRHQWHAYLGRPASTVRSRTFSTCRTESAFNVAGIYFPHCRRRRSALLLDRPVTNLSSTISTCALCR